MDKLLKLCQQYNYISFDLYDTLIWRNVAKAADVFNLIAESFTQNRLEAELKSRKKKTSVEVNLSDIYQELLSKYSEQDCALYKKAEIDIEKNITCKNPYLYEIYRTCLKMEKHLFITTDMYLPIDVIKEILSKNGYSDYERLYLSSELKLTKHNGTLFDYILDDNRIAPKQLLHIGDNFLSDILHPRMKGIKTYWIKRHHYSNNGTLTARTLNAFLKNAANKSFGYQYFGSLLYGYVKWLDDELKNNNFDKILFFSREGCFIKKAYETIASKKSLHTMYFYTSRRALQVPAFAHSPDRYPNIDYNEIMTGMFLPYSFTIAWLIKHWGLQPESYLEQIDSVGLDISTKLNKFDVLKNPQIINLFNHLKEQITKNAMLEHDAFLSYLNKNNIYGNIAIVDIGWSGNMQKAFKKSVAEYPVNITGYYFAIRNNFSKMNSYIPFEALIDLYVATALELFFMAHHGTTIRYVNDDVELADFEYAGTDTEKNVKQIQADALQFLEDFKQIGNLLKNESKVYTHRLFKMFQHPTLEEVKYCTKLKAWDEGWIPLVETQKLITYVKNPKLLKKDLLRNSWKIGFLKKLFKIPAPYYSILKIARKQMLKRV